MRSLVLEKSRGNRSLIDCDFNAIERDTLCLVVTIGDIK